jgi:thiamine-monophosphate kinase
MDEFDALSRLSDVLGVGDDCATIETPEDANLLLTTDMLHDETDFPEGVTPRTVGWRTVAVSLSDIGGSGGRAAAVVAVYAAPDFDDLEEFVRGARDACESVGAEYVGGDLDGHDERTVVSTALGATDEPVGRDGAHSGEAVAVTGSLGRTAVALREFENGNYDRANELFAFEPRVAEGNALAPHATAMTDLSDGIAVGLHNLAEASDVSFEAERDSLPTLDETRDEDLYVGEDYELLFTLPQSETDAVRDALKATDTEMTLIGETVEKKDMNVRMDGEPLGRRGYEH